MSSPAVIIKCKGSTSVKGFTKYVTREEALKEVKSQVKRFSEYAFNNEKTDRMGLFNQNEIGIGVQQQKAFINNAVTILNQCDDKQRYMFKDVVSFDNDYLKENNLINRKNEVNLKEVSRIVQTAYSKHARDLDMSEDFQLLGAIHLNTDNIHVHVGLVDKNFNEKYTRPMKPIRNIKNSIVNEIDRDLRKELFKDIDRLRLDLKKEILFSANKDPQQEMLKKITKELPNNPKEWRMKSNAIAMEKPKELVKKYIDQELKINHPKQFNEFQKLISRNETINKRLYGEGIKKNIGEEKIKRFYEETGNVIFKSLKLEKEKMISKPIQLDLAKEKLQNHLIQPKNTKSVLVEKKISTPKIPIGSYKRYSEKNQKIIKENIPNASIVFTKNHWKSLGGELDSKAIGITIVQFDKTTREFKELNVYDISQLKNQETMLTKIKEFDLTYKSHKDFMQQNKEINQSEKSISLTQTSQKLSKEIGSGFSKLLTSLRKSAISIRDPEFNQKRKLELEHGYEKNF